MVQLTEDWNLGKLDKNTIIIWMSDALIKSNTTKYYWIYLTDLKSPTIHLYFCNISLYYSSVLGKYHFNISFFNLDLKEWGDWFYD